MKGQYPLIALKSPITSKATIIIHTADRTASCFLLVYFTNKSIVRSKMTGNDAPTQIARESLTRSEYVPGSFIVLESLTAATVAQQPFTRSVTQDDLSLICLNFFTGKFSSHEIFLLIHYFSLPVFRCSFQKMGGGLSTVIFDNKNIGRLQMIQLVMPAYYMNYVKIAPEDIVIARESWGYIINNTSPAFIAMKNCNEMENSFSCLVWFYNSFYDRLFEVGPTARSLFKKNLQAQGRALVAMLSGALSLLEGVNTLVDNLIDLAHMHKKINVRALDYGPVGLVLLWTLEHCIGDSFTPEIKHIWLKIYSLMLSVMIPINVDDELKQINANDKKLSSEAQEFIFSTANITPPITTGQFQECTNRTAPTLCEGDSMIRKISRIFSMGTTEKVHVALEDDDDDDEDKKSDDGLPHHEEFINIDVAEHVEETE
eukprot:gene8151-16758_t